MSFFKRISRVFHPLAKVFDRQKATSQKLSERDAQLAALQGENDPQKKLDNELANYRKIGTDSMDSATEQAKKAGTFADTPAAKIQMQGEADAQARFGRRSSLQKINALQKQLGVTETPEGQI